MDSIIAQPPEDPTPVIRIFCSVLAGDPEFHEDIWNGLVVLSRAKYPAEIIQSFLATLGIFKIAPITGQEIDNLRVLQTMSQDLLNKINKLEQSEGGHSMELNKQKIGISAKIVELQLGV